MDLVQTVRKEGSRGGRADFKWEDVKGDTQRENYLGHSLMAPVGRWQKGRDLNWYAKGDNEDDQRTEAEKIKEEKRKLKEAEEDAMLAAMGLPVPQRASTNANLTPLGEKAQEADVQKAMAEKAEEGGDEERKERKHRSKREHKDRDDDRRRRRRSRSRSRDRRDRRRDRSRSRDRRRDGGRDDKHRHRSRSHDRRPREERRHRHREPYSDEERPRSRSRDRHRRRRSRSPYEKHERRRD